MEILQTSDDAATRQLIQLRDDVDQLLEAWPRPSLSGPGGSPG